MLVKYMSYKKGVKRSTYKNQRNLYSRKRFDQGTRTLKSLNRFGKAMSRKTTTKKPSSFINPTAATAVAMMNMFKTGNSLSKDKGAFDCKREIPSMYEYKPMKIKIIARSDLTYSIPAAGFVNKFGHRLDDIFKCMEQLNINPVTDIKGIRELQTYFNNYTVIRAKATHYDSKMINSEISGTIVDIFTQFYALPRSELTAINQKIFKIDNCRRRTPQAVQGVRTGTAKLYNKRSCLYKIKYMPNIYNKSYLEDMKRVTTGETPNVDTENQINCFFNVYASATPNGIVTLPNLNNETHSTVLVIEFDIIAFNRKDL